VENFLYFSDETGNFSGICSVRDFIANQGFESTVTRYKGPIDSFKIGFSIRSTLFQHC